MITDSNWNDGHFTHFHFTYSSKFGKFMDDGVTLVPKCGKPVMLLSTQHRTSTVTSVDEEAGDYYIYTSAKQRAVLTFWTNWCERTVASTHHLHGLWRFFLNMINALRNAGAAWASSKRLTCHHHQAAWDIATDILRHRQTVLALPCVSEEEERKTMRECDTCRTPLDLQWACTSVFR